MEEYNNNNMFSNSSFDVTNWVNGLVKQASETAQEGEDREEVVISAIRTASQRLQVNSQEITIEVEKLMEKLLLSAPRASTEVDRLERFVICFKKKKKKKS